MNIFESILRGALGPLAGLVMGPEPDARAVIVALLRAGQGVLNSGVAGNVSPIVYGGLDGLVGLVAATDQASERDALMGLAETFAAAAERAKFQTAGSEATPTTTES